MALYCNSLPSLSLTFRYALLEKARGVSVPALRTLVRKRLASLLYTLFLIVRRAGTTLAYLRRPILPV